MRLSTGFRHPLGNGFLTEIAGDGDGFHVEANFNYYNPDFSAYHIGEDWNADTGGNADLGLPVYAISNGTVVERGVNDAFGNYLFIRHDLPFPITVGGITTSSVYSMYGHLQNPAIVPVDQDVAMGQQIGNMGYTGMADGNAHVHLEIRLGYGAGYQNMDGYSFDPPPSGWVDATDFINAYRTLDTAGNTMATARVVTIGSTPATFNDYVGPSDTSDYFRFATDRATNLALGLTGLTADADVYLLNAQGAEVAHSYNFGTASEAININSLAAGTYYVQVRPYDGASTNYNLSISATATDQAGNTMATAHVVTIGSTPATFYDYVGPYDTNDYFRFTTAGATNFALSLTGLTDDADVYLLNAQGTEVAHSYNFGTTPETININSLAAGTYYVDVRGYNDASTNFALSLSAATADQAGNTMAAARTVTLGSTASTFSDYVGPADANDYYKFVTTGPTKLALGLTGLTDDADVYLLNSQGVEVAHSYNSGAASEAININNLAAGTYYIQVRPYDGASTNYNLSVSATANPTDLAGNTMATARAVSLGPTHSTFSDYVGSTDADDYFKFVVTAPTKLAASLTGLSDDADLYLYNSNGTEVAHSYNFGTASEAINFNLSAGTYFVDVHSYHTASTNYALDLLGTPL